VLDPQQYGNPDDQP